MKIIPKPLLIAAAMAMGTSTIAQTTDFPEGAEPLTLEALHAALAGKVHEDVAISGIGEGMDNGREALRERLARHFEAFDESYRDALVMTDAGGTNAAVRLTAHGRSAGGDTYNAFARAYNEGSGFDTGIPMDEAVMAYITDVLGGVISAETYGEPQGRETQIK